MIVTVFRSRLREDNLAQYPALAPKISERGGEAFYAEYSVQICGVLRESKFGHQDGAW